MRLMRRLLASPAIAAALVLLAFIIVVQTPLAGAHPVGARHLFSENELVEQLTVYFWVASSFASIARGVRGERGYRVDFVLLAFVFLILAARELDLNRHLFEWNMTRFVNYKKSYIPLRERLLAAFGVLLPIATIAFTLVARNAKRLLQALKERAIWSYEVAFWIALILLTRAADKIAQSVHVERSHVMLMGIEESGECILAIYTLLLMLPRRRRTVASS